jgi:hypothetical protein
MRPALREIVVRQITLICAIAGLVELDPAARADKAGRRAFSPTFLHHSA